MHPFFSIVIPTRNSSTHLDISVTSIKKQTWPHFEIIIADNESKDDTISKAKKLGARVINILGKAPQVCQQRNIGASISKGKYIIFLDHDMELLPDFLSTLYLQIKKNPNIDAFYIPEKMKASSHILSAMRTFENSCYEDTPIVAARVIKKKSYFRTKGYDVKLSAGPADWDFELIMRRKKYLFATSQISLIHHEENLSYWDYVKKKKQYHKGVDIYKEKWRKLDYLMYKKYVTRQFSLSYRLLFVFLENGKWINTVKNFHLYVFFLMTRFFMFWYY